MACLDLEGRNVLVVGGGPVALEKVEGLLDLRRRRHRRRAARSRAELRAARRRRCAAAATAATTSTGASSSSPRPRRPSRQPPGLRRRRGARAALQRRRRPRALQLHPPRRPPASTRSRSRSRPAAPHPPSRSGSATRSPPSSRPEHATLARRLRDLRPWAKETFRRTRSGATTSSSSSRRSARSGLTRCSGLFGSPAAGDCAEGSSMITPSRGPGDPADHVRLALRLRRRRLRPARVARSSSTRRPPTRSASAATGWTRQQVDRAARRARARPRRRPPQGRRPVRLRPRQRGARDARARPGSTTRSSRASRRSPPFPRPRWIPVTHRGLSDRVTIATAHAADGSEPDYDALAARRRHARPLHGPRRGSPSSPPG